MHTFSPCLLLLLSCGPGLRAQDWEPVDAQQIGAACFDTVRGRLVRIGEDGTTWEWDGVRWLQRTAPGPPPPILGLFSPEPNQLVYDRARRRVMALLRDYQTLAEYDGTSWSSLAPPPNTTPEGIAYDALRSRLVLLAQRSNTIETWELGATGWSRVLTSSSPPTGTLGLREPLAFDPLSGKVMLFLGGVGQMVIWSYDGVDWTVSSSGTPTARTGHQVGFDALRQRMVVYGGALPFFPPRRLTDVWEWDGVGWTQVASATNDVLTETGLLFDTTTGRLLAVDVRGAVHRWDGASWSVAAAAPGPQIGSFLADPIGGTALMVGPQDTWSWSRSGWLQVSSQLTEIDNAYAGQGGLVHGVALFPAAESWVWSGTTWVSLGTPTTAPTPRLLYGLAYDAGRNRAVLFGGYDYQNGLQIGDTWEFDGLNWQAMSPAQAPSARQSPKMIHDPLRGHVLLVGGANGGTSASTYLGDSWTYDGINWQPASTVPAPFLGTWPFGQPFDLRFDAATGLPIALVFEQQTVDVHEHNGTDWQLRLSIPTAAEFDAGYADLADDPNTGTLLVHTGQATYRLAAVPGTSVLGGTACGAAPRLAARAVPRRAAAGFGLDVTGSPGPAFVGLSTTSASTPLGGGCTLQLGTLSLSFFVVTSPDGFAEIALPIPDSPVFAGLSLFAQAAQIDPTTPIGLALSRQLAMTVGD
ncbi:MAG: hypothetical protein AB7O97_11315 [Planctomycetota bacterium]